MSFQIDFWKCRKREITSKK